MIEFDDKHGHLAYLGIDTNSSNEKGISIEMIDGDNLFLRKEELEKFIEILIDWKNEL